jgi:hypothetical protein
MLATAARAASPPAATPTFSPSGGTFNAPQSVTISETTPGATIYFTTNGSNPSTRSTLYNGPVTISATTTLKAIAVATGYSNSAIAGATYTMVAAAPTFSPPAGTYSPPLGVTLWSTTPGVKIYYTTDGSTPTTSSQQFWGPIVLNSNATLKAIATATGYSNSSVSSASYAVQPLPDLYLSSVSGPSSAMVGDTVQLSARATLGGSPIGSIATSVSFYLSSDSTISTADTLIASVPVTFQPGETKYPATTYRVSSSLPTGSYWLGAIIDPTNVVTESSEDDNSVVGGSVQILADTRPPTITITGVSEGLLASASVTACYTISESNPSTDLGELDLIPFQGCADASTAGSHVLTVTATDEYVNTANTTINFTIDLAPPSLTIVATSPESVVTTSSVAVSVTAQDDIGVASVSANGIALVPADGAYQGQVPLGGDGKYVIRCTATDGVGRTATTSVTIYRDTGLPGTYLCYDATGNVTARLRCALGTDCSAGCPQ